MTTNMTQAQLIELVDALNKQLQEKSEEIELLESTIDDDQYIISYLKKKVVKPLIDPEEEFGIDIKCVMKVHEKYDRLKSQYKKEEQDFIDSHGEELDVNEDEAEEFLEMICDTEQFKQLVHHHESKLDRFLERAYRYLFKHSDIKYNDDEKCDKFGEWFDEEF